MMYEHPDARDTPGLEEYLRAVRSRWPFVVVALVLFVLLALIFVRARTATFEAEARVLVNPAPIARTQANQLPRVVLEREAGVLKSVRTADRVLSELGTGGVGSELLRDIDVQFEPASDILSVFAVRTDADDAALVANTFAQAYVELRNEDADDVDEQTITRLSEELDRLLVADAEVRDERDDVSRTLATVDATVGVRVTAQLNALNTELNQLQAEVRNVRADLSDAQREQQTRGTAAEVLQFDTEADFNGISDNTIFAAGILAGLVIGISGAWLLDRLDRTARELSDVELAVGSTVLGTVPEFGLGNRSGAAAIVMRSNAKSEKVQRARESFRRLRSSMQFHSQTHNHKSYVVTSARPGEGKSVTVTNLAVATAQAGASVVLVSADMRRPTVEKLLGLPQPQHGLSSYLSGSEKFDIALRVESLPSLTVIPSGATPANPGELLAGNRFGDLIDELEGSFDFVFVDAPPVLSAADSMAAAVHTDAVIIVVDSQNTESHELERVSAEIRRAGGSVAGAVLNRERTGNDSIFRRDRYAYERAARVGAS